MPTQNSYRPDPGWITRAQAADAHLQRQITRRAVCELAINTARISVGLWPYGVGLDGKPRRGRPPAQHPLPRRQFSQETSSPSEMAGIYTAEEHRERHKAEFYPGCRRCRYREKLYFQTHPERRPKGIKTEGADEWGITPTVVDCVTPGWKKKRAEQEQIDSEMRKMQNYMSAAAKGELDRLKPEAPALTGKALIDQALRDWEARHGR